MGTVNAGASMSLDGFIADPSGEVGPLFDWYFNGDVEFPTAGGRWVFKTSEASARHLREIWNRAGALVVGRGEFDKTQAWGGLHPLGSRCSSSRAGRRPDGRSPRHRRPRRRRSRS